MRRFSYVACDQTGVDSAGVVYARREESARAKLEEKGLLVISLVEDTGWVARLFRIGSVKAEDLTFFAEEFATLIHGGVPVARALKMLSMRSPNPAFRPILDGIVEEVDKGRPLSAAFADHPEVFDDIWVSLVRAGEASGSLVENLRQLASYLRAGSALRSRVATAMAYPGMLVGATVLFLVAFLVKIAPGFEESFTQFGIKVPPLTAAILAASRLLRDEGVAVSAVVLGTAAMARAYLATAAGRAAFDSVLLKIPVFGPLYTGVLLERLLSSLRTLVKNGVSLASSLKVLEGAFGSSPTYAAALSSMCEDIDNGKSFSLSLRRTGVFPRLVYEICEVGEEAGKLPETMGLLGDFYRMRVDQSVRRLTAVLDPLLIVGVAAVVGVVVAATFLPIISMTRMGGGG